MCDENTAKLEDIECPEQADSDLEMINAGLGLFDVLSTIQRAAQNVIETLNHFSKTFFMTVSERSRSHVSLMKKNELKVIAYK